MGHAPLHARRVRGSGNQHRHAQRHVLGELAGKVRAIKPLIVRMVPVRQPHRIALLLHAFPEFGGRKPTGVIDARHITRSLVVRIDPQPHARCRKLRHDLADAIAISIRKAAGVSDGQLRRSFQVRALGNRARSQPIGAIWVEHRPRRAVDATERLRHFGTDAQAGRCEAVGARRWRRFARGEIQDRPARTIPADHAQSARAAGRAGGTAVRRRRRSHAAP